MQFNFLKKGVYSFLFFIIFSISSYAIVSDASLEKISQDFEKKLEEGRKRLGIQGCVAVVARKNKIMHTICLGTTDVNCPQKITTETLFPLSSLTKNITAFVVAALVDQKVISFDDKVKKYLPNFFIGNEDISEKFTIRDLISHRSGFHHFLGNSLWHAGYSYEQMVNSLRYINNVSGFRKKYGYQNIIFGIIEEVLEAATGEEFGELVDKYIFSKMKLEHSSTRPLYIEKSYFAQFRENFKKHGVLYALKNIFNIKTHQVVSTHSAFKGKMFACKANDYFQRVIATAGVSMSAEDFGSWLRMLLNEGVFNGARIVSKKSYAELTSNQVNVTDLKKDNQVFPQERLKNPYYGMGVFGAEYVDSDRENGRKILFHMGGVYGACTFFAYSPSDDIAIGVLANTGGTDKTIFAELMTWEFFDRLFDFKKIDWVQKELDSKKKIEVEKIMNYKDLAESNPGTHAKLSEYTGTFTSKIYGDVKIYTKDNMLVINIGTKEAPLKHLNRDIFEFQGIDLCDDFFDRDEFVAFYKNEQGFFDKVYISCFDENKTVFEKK